MHRTLKLILKIAFGVIIIFALGVFIAQTVLENKIRNLLEEELPPSVKLNYSSTNLSLLSNHFDIQDVTVSRIGQTTGDPNATIAIKKLYIDNIDYWDYIFNSKVEIENLQITEPKITYYQNKKIEKKSFNVSKLEGLNKLIIIKNFSVNDGFVTVKNALNDSLVLDVKKAEFFVRDLSFSGKKGNGDKPFNFKDYNLKYDELFFHLSEFENLTAKKSNFSKESFVIRDLKLKTKYSKSELSRIIKVERDHFDLKLDSLVLNNFDLYKNPNATLTINCPKIILHSPKLEVYRDKLVADDLSIKKMYSEKLRNLKHKLTLDEILVKNANITYLERVKSDRPVGKISFSKFEATVNNVSNTYKSPDKTTVKVDALFMDHAPFNHTMAFDVNDENDAFVFRGEMSDLKSEYLNAFTIASLNVKTDGEIEKTYFTISGNAEQSMIDLKTKFKKFDVQVLRKDGEEKNRVLSDIVNIFVKKNSSDKDGFKEAHVQNIQRDKTKSLFNFIWISTKAGLEQAMTIK